MSRKKMHNCAFADFGPGPTLASGSTTAGRRSLGKLSPRWMLVMSVEDFRRCFEFLQRESDALCSRRAGFPHRQLASPTSSLWQVSANIAGRSWSGGWPLVNPTSSAIGARARAARSVEILPTVNHHPELRAPVADDCRDHLVPEELRDPGERIAKNGAANVTDVHRLGDVRRTEVDHDAVPRLGQRNA